MKTCLLALFLSVTAVAGAQPPTGGKRLLVVSGGGARGAWGVGYARYLDSTGSRYSTVVGTSTGALMAPFILLRKFDTLIRAYTNVEQKDIFNVNPFRQDGGIKIGKAVFRIVFGKETLGESKPLKGLINEFMPAPDYAQIRAQGLDFAVAVANHRTHRVEYRFASQIADYDSMVNWIWASANEPVFMSIYKTPGPNGTTDAWVDGGLRDNVPIMQGLTLALDSTNNYEAVDVIVNNLPVTDDSLSRWPEKPETERGKINVINSLFRTLITYRNGVRDMNQRMAVLFNRLSQVSQGAGAGLSARVGETMPGPGIATDTRPPIKLTFYYMPDSLFKLIPNELRFEKEKMRRLVDAGRNGSVAQPISNMRVSAVSIVGRTLPSDSTSRDSTGAASALRATDASPAPANAPQTFIISRDALRKILRDLQ